MQGKNSYEDELTRRREARRQAAMKQETCEEPEEEKLPQFSWRETAALIIAAYQVLFPVILAMLGAMAAAYLLFYWYFL